MGLAGPAGLAGLVGLAGLAGAPPKIEERRLSRLSICRRIETASSKALTDISMLVT